MYTNFRAKNYHQQCILPRFDSKREYLSTLADLGENRSLSIFRMRKNNTACKIDGQMKNSVS